MNVLICPDKFKGSLSAFAVANAIANGIQNSDASIHCLIKPMADGGDGTLAVLKDYLDLNIISMQVEDPLGRPISCKYGQSGTSAYIELAEASGIVRLHESERNPLLTSSYGTGQLIANAIQNGAKNIFLFLGGSASNDGAMGIAQALGYHFYDKDGKRLLPIGQSLGKVSSIQISAAKSLEGIQFFCLCDVNNPLLGPKGAVHVFAKQKGASREDIHQLEKGMKHYASIVKNRFGKDITMIEGGGAAGGIAAGMAALFNATILSGMEKMLEWTQLEKAIQEADIVISGEGRLDSQSLDGKVIGEIAKLTKKHKKPLMVFAGQNILSKGEQEMHGIHKVYSVLARAQNLEEAMQRTAFWLEEMAFEHFVNAYS
jgi:glycerate kinase